MHTSPCGLRSSGAPKLISTHLILQDVAQGVPIFAGLLPSGRLGIVYVLFSSMASVTASKKDKFGTADSGIVPLACILHLICTEVTRDPNPLVQRDLVGDPL